MLRLRKFGAHRLVAERHEHFFKPGPRFTSKGRTLPCIVAMAATVLQLMEGVDNYPNDDVREEDHHAQRKREEIEHRPQAIDRVHSGEHDRVPALAVGELCQNRRRMSER